MVREAKRCSVRVVVPLEVLHDHVVDALQVKAHLKICFPPMNPDCHLRSAGVVARVRHGAAALLQVVPHHQRHLPHSRVGPKW